MDLATLNIYPVCSRGTVERSFSCVESVRLDVWPIFREILRRHFLALVDTSAMGSVGIYLTYFSRAT